MLVALVSIAGLIGLADSLRGVASNAAVSQSAVPAATSPMDAPTGQVAVRPPAIGSVAGGSGQAAVTLRMPTGRDGPITSAAVRVNGLVSLRASSIRVALELDKFNRIDAIDIDTNPDGMLRPDTTPSFHVDLALPTPRPIGAAWVVVTAYDRSGNSLGTLRRAVLIGAAAAG